MGWLIVGGDNTGVGAVLPQVTEWDPAASPGAGVFKISDPIVLQPIITPTADTKGNTVTWAFDDTIPGHGVELYFDNNLLASEGGELPDIELVYDDVNTNILTLEKSGTHSYRFKITVSDDGSKEVNDLKNLLDGDADFPTFFTLTDNTAGVGDLSTKIGRAGGWTYPAPATYKPTKQPFEREMHRIETATLNTFFTLAFNRLRDGDTLAIYFPYLVDPDDFLDPGSGANGGRRQACDTNNNVNIGPGAGTAGELVNLGRMPEVLLDTLPYSIPVCKRVENDLYFADGTVIKGALLITDPPIYFGEHGYTLARFSGSAGASQIGVNGVATGAGASADKWSIPTDALQNVLVDAQTFMNNKASLNAAETVTSKWKFTNPLLELDDLTVVVRDAFTANEWYLTYANNANANAWETTRIYEYRDVAGKQGGYAIIIGGVLNPAGTLITSPVAGTGNLSVYMIMGSKSIEANSTAVVAPTTKDPSNYLHWQSYQSKDAAVGSRYSVKSGTLHFFLYDMRIQGHVGIGTIAPTQANILEVSELTITDSLTIKGLKVATKVTGGDHASFHGLYSLAEFALDDTSVHVSGDVCGGYLGVDIASHATNKGDIDGDLSGLSIAVTVDSHTTIDGDCAGLRIGMDNYGTVGFDHGIRLQNTGNKINSFVYSTGAATYGIYISGDTVDYNVLRGNTSVGPAALVAPDISLRIGGGLGLTSGGYATGIREVTIGAIAPSPNVVDVTDLGILQVVPTNDLDQITGITGGVLGQWLIIMNLPAASEIVILASSAIIGSSGVNIASARGVLLYCYSGTGSGLWALAATC
jgi:hypothetical protein